MNRTTVYEEARAKNPERWAKEIRDWSLEDRVWLNPEKHDKLNCIIGKSIS